MASFVHPPKISSISGCCWETPTNRVCNTGNVQNLDYGGRESKARVKICSKIKDVESRVTNLGNDVRFYGQFSALVKESKEEKEKYNYYVNTGDTIRTFREEFSDLLYMELSFGIYRFALQKNGKSCRLRWINYLRPGLRQGNFTLQEETVLTLHGMLGNK